MIGFCCTTSTKLQALYEKTKPYGIGEDKKRSGTSECERDNSKGTMMMMKVSCLIKEACVLF